MNSVKPDRSEIVVCSQVCVFSATTPGVSVLRKTTTQINKLPFLGAEVLDEVP